MFNINKVLMLFSFDMYPLPFMLWCGLNFFLIFTFLSVFCLSSVTRQGILMLSFVGSCFAFLCSLGLLFCFYMEVSPATSPSLTIEFTWFPLFPLILSIDAVSCSLILLTTFLFPFCFLYSFFNIAYKFKEFLLLLLSIEFFLVQVFSVIDLLFFYLVFEAILIPMFLLIGIWGSRRRRVHAAYQFFFYTSFGSFLMLLALIYIYLTVGSFDIRVLTAFSFSFYEELFLWFAFFIAFAIKVPIFPFHI